MTDDKRNYGAYTKASQAVDEIRQVIMLYEGVINFTKQIKGAIENNEPEKRYNLIQKATSIITGLNSCLEFNEKTEETSKALDSFYQDIDMRLLYLNMNDSVESCDQIIEDLQTMLNAWLDVEREVKSSKNDKTNDKTDDFANETTGFQSDDQTKPETSSENPPASQSIEINI